MSKLPLVEGVKKYVKENNILFCTPGHKGGRGFLITEEGKWIYEHLLQCDITEVDGLDNLHKPEGIIEEAAQLLSHYYGSKKSYFLVNGSTSGNLAMIFSCFEEGDKIIVERNCHKSILNGIILKKLVPIYIKNKISNKYNAPLSIDMEHFSYLIEQNKDAKGIIITYPNYYGVCMDLEKIIHQAKAYHMKVLVDSAHGAHFGVSKNLPKNPVLLGADMVVMSAHKTLPSLTQASYLHVGQDMKIENVDLYVNMFSSTSPSYLFLCSMDYARYYLEEYGEREYNHLIELVLKYRILIEGLNEFSVLKKEDIEGTCDIDLTRLVIHLKNGGNGHSLSKYLREKGIQVEMSDERNVILILSPFYDEEEFEHLYNMLKGYTVIEPIKNIDLLNKTDPVIRFLPYEIPRKAKKRIKIEDAEGEVCAEAIVPYPPGVPLIMPGEVINNDVIERLEGYKSNNTTVLGINEGTILVVKLDS